MLHLLPASVSYSPVKSTYHKHIDCFPLFLMSEWKFLSRFFFFLPPFFVSALTSLISFTLTPQLCSRCLPHPISPPAFLNSGCWVAKSDLNMLIGLNTISSDINREKGDKAFCGFRISILSHLLSVFNFYNSSLFVLLLDLHGGRKRQIRVWIVQRKMERSHVLLL